MRVRVSEEILAFSLEDVAEVIEIDSVAPLFRLPACVRGVLNLRGQIRPLVDLSAVLGLPADGGRKAVLVGREGREAAFLVSEVLAVERSEGTGLAEVPSTIAEEKRGLYRGLIAARPGEPPALLLSSEALFAREIWGRPS